MGLESAIIQFRNLENREEMVTILLGAKWLPAVPILRLLCVYAGVRAIDILLSPVLFGRRRERFLFWYCLALLILAATALMTIMVLLLREFVLSGRGDAPLIRLIFLSAGGAIAYGAALFAIGSPVFTEGAEVMGWIFRRRTAGRLTLSAQIGK